MVAVLAKEMTCIEGRGSTNSGTGMVHSGKWMDWHLSSVCFHHNDHSLMGQNLRKERIYFGSQFKNTKSTIVRWHGDRDSSVLGAKQGTEE